MFSSCPTLSVVSGVCPLALQHLNALQQLIYLSLILLWGMVALIFPLPMKQQSYHVSVAKQECEPKSCKSWGDSLIIFVIVFQNRIYQKNRPHHLSSPILKSLTLISEHPYETKDVWILQKVYRYFLAFSTVQLGRPLAIRCKSEVQERDFAFIVTKSTLEKYLRKMQCYWSCCWRQELEVIRIAATHGNPSGSTKTAFSAS